MFTLILAAHAAELRVDLAPIVARGAPALVSGQPVLRCGGERLPLTAVSARLTVAERAIAYLDFAGARAELGRVREALLCASEPIAGNLAARVPFLEGVVAHLSGEGDAAALFRESLVLRPMQPWDPDFPPEAMLVFDDARARVEGADTVPLTLMPAPADGALWVDGQRWRGTDGRLDLRPGAHYLQLADAGWETLIVEVAAEDTLVVPAWVPDDLDAWVGDPARGEALARMLGRHFEPGLPLRIDTAGGAWTGSVEGAAWSPLPPPPLPKRSPYPTLGIALSGATFAVGAALLTTGLTGMYAAIDEAETTENYDDYKLARGRYLQSTDGLGAACWIAGAGAAGLAVSLPLVVLEDTRYRQRLREAVR